MISRQDLGSWLEGGPSRSTEYPGERLGRPIDGPASVARFVPRFFGLCIDWILAMVIANLFLAQWNQNGLMNLTVLFALNVLMVGAFGRTPGHWLMGLQVQTMNGRPAGFGKAAIRSLLLCLVIPPVIYDQDQRGLHDRAVGTILVKVR